jgi:hypothetical protein
LSKTAIPPKKPDMWLIEALETRLVEHSREKMVPLDRGLIYHLVRALREARGIEIYDEEMYTKNISSEEQDA